MPTRTETHRSDAPNPSQTVVLHDGGDAVLLIGPEECPRAVRASKMIMSLASPVWKAMFERRSWLESTATDIPFPDDDADAMLIVLRIAHLRFKEIPSKEGLSLEDLFQVAIICDKYDTVGIVRPFMDLHCWTVNLIPDIESRTRCDPSWSFIAWTFGYDDSFDALARHLALTVSLGVNDQPELESNSEINPDELPSDILDSIMKIREITILQIVNACHNFINKIIQCHTCQIKDITGTNLNPKECRTMILGSCMEWMLSRNMYPKDGPAGDNIKVSVEALVTDLNSMAIGTYTSHNYGAVAKYCNENRSWKGMSPYDLHGKGARSHIICHKKHELEAEVQRIVAEMPSPTLESHRRHMEEQAKK